MSIICLVRDPQATSDSFYDVVSLTVKPGRLTSFFHVGYAIRCIGASSSAESFLGKAPDAWCDISTSGPRWTMELLVCIFVIRS